jgi:hypothetical protein
VLLSVGKNPPQMGCLAFPFIDQGKELGYTRERERERERKRKRRKRKNR